MARTLLDISADLQALDDLLAEVDGDITDPRVDEAVTAWMAELGADLTTKLDNYCALICDLEARADVHGAEANRMAKREKSENQAAAFLKAKMKFILEQHALAKVQTPRYRVSIVRNGGAAPVVVEPGTVVPYAYMRVIPEQLTPDKEKLREALESGKEIPGVSLGVRGTSLSIK